MKPHYIISFFIVPLLITGCAAVRPVTDIAAELLLKHHSAVELTKRMEKAGLVVRNRNPENRRKVDLSLTAAGLKTLETLAELHRDELLRHGDRIQRAITFL